MIRGLIAASNYPIQFRWLDGHVLELSLDLRAVALQECGALQLQSTE